MEFTSLCAFEITDKCNRANEHPQCPNASDSRWSHSLSSLPMTDDQIVGVAREMIAGGFAGVFAWHHYCEPLLAWPRIVELTARIKAISSAARFLLWTNGDLLHTIPDSEIAGMFYMTVVSNYAKRNLDRAKEICPNFHELPGHLDWRLNPPTSREVRTPHCVRPYLEIVFDFFGNVRTCCMDWRNEMNIGNIHLEPFSDLWARWLVHREKIAAQPMAKDAPMRCKTCGTRYTHLADYVPEVAAKARQLWR